MGWFNFKRQTVGITRRHSWFQLGPAASFRCTRPAVQVGFNRAVIGIKLRIGKSKAAIRRTICVNSRASSLVMARPRIENSR